MRLILSLLIGAVLGIPAGALAALFAAGILGSGGGMGNAITISGWNSNWTTGSSEASPWTKARVARHGLLALTKEEAVYFTRTTDDDGQRLSENCTYRVSGGEMPALWWSITLYDGESYLPRNKDRALSFDQTKAEATGEGDSWSFTIASEGPETGNWVSSNAAGNFDVTLRLYKPSAALLETPEAVLPAPKIKRLSCGGAA